MLARDVGARDSTRRRKTGCLEVPANPDPRKGRHLPAVVATVILAATASARPGAPATAHAIQSQLLVQSYPFPTPGGGTTEIRQDIQVLAGAILTEEAEDLGLDLNDPSCIFVLSFKPDSMDVTGSAGASTGPLNAVPGATQTQGWEINVFPIKLTANANALDDASPGGPAITEEEWEVNLRNAVRHELLHVCFRQGTGTECPGPIPPPKPDPESPEGKQEALSNDCEELAVAQQSIEDLCDVIHALNVDLFVKKFELQQATSLGKPAEVLVTIEAEIAELEARLAAACSALRAMLDHFNDPDGKWRDSLAKCHEEGLPPESSDRSCDLTLPANPEGNDDIFTLDCECED